MSSTDGGFRARVKLSNVTFHAGADQNGHWESATATLSGHIEYSMDADFNWTKPHPQMAIEQTTAVVEIRAQDPPTRHTRGYWPAEIRPHIGYMHLTTSEKYEAHRLVAELYIGLSLTTLTSLLASMRDSLIVLPQFVHDLDTGDRVSQGELGDRGLLLLIGRLDFINEP